MPVSLHSTWSKFASSLLHDRRQLPADGFVSCIRCSPLLGGSGRIRIAADPILLIGHTTLPPLLAGTLTLLADSIWTSSTPQRTELTTALPSALALHRTTVGIGPSSHGPATNLAHLGDSFGYVFLEMAHLGDSFGYVFLDAALIAQGGVQVTFLSSCVGCPIYVADHSSLPPLCFSSFFLSCISRFR